MGDPPSRPWPPPSSTGDPPPPSSVFFPPLVPSNAQASLNFQSRVPLNSTLAALDTPSSNTTALLEAFRHRSSMASAQPSVSTPRVLSSEDQNRSAMFPIAEISTVIAKALQAFFPIAADNASSSAKEQTIVPAVTSDPNFSLAATPTLDLPRLSSEQDSRHQQVLATVALGHNVSPVQNSTVAQETSGLMQQAAAVAQGSIAPPNVILAVGNDSTMPTNSYANALAGPKQSSNDLGFSVSHLSPHLSR